MPAIVDGHEPRGDSVKCFVLLASYSVGSAPLADADIDTMIDLSEVLSSYDIEI